MVQSLTFCTRSWKSFSHRWIGSDIHGFKFAAILWCAFYVLIVLNLNNKNVIKLLI